MKVLIVDDEPLARRGVRVCLNKAPEIEIVGECSSGQEALRCIPELRPDLVFLDIQMPGMTGFDVATRIDAEAAPLIIFLTAYDEFALRAFSIHAVDYILKPIHDARFAEALQIARQRLLDRQARSLMGNIQLMLKEQPRSAEQQGYLDRIQVKTGSKSLFIPIEAVEWIEAAGDYVALHVGKSTHLIRETLDGFERQIDPAKFVRIHRSTIIARKQIKQLRSLPSRDAAVLLEDGTELRASRRYRARISMPKSS